jgi:hypothetical protein
MGDVRAVCRRVSAVLPQKSVMLVTAEHHQLLPNLPKLH